MRKLLLVLLGAASTIIVNAQTFTIDTISDAIFHRMQGKSYKADCKIPRSELRYLQLSYYDATGKEYIG